MLAAGTRAAAEVDADFVLDTSRTWLSSSTDEFEHAVLRLGDGEVAEFDAGAAHAAFAEVGPDCSRAPKVVEFGLLSAGEIGFRDVERGAGFACWSGGCCPGRARCISRRGSEIFAEVAVADASAGEADADPVEVALLLLVDADVVGLLIARDDGEVGVRLQLASRAALRFPSSIRSCTPVAMNKNLQRERCCASVAVAVIAVNLA